MNTNTTGRAKRAKGSARRRRPRKVECFDRLPSNVVPFPHADDRTAQATDATIIEGKYADLYRQAASLYHRLEAAGRATTTVVTWFTCIESALDNLADACCRRGGA